MKRGLRFIAGTLIFCILFTGYPGLFGKGSVFAAPESEGCLVEAPQDQSEAAWQDQDGEWQFGSFAEAVSKVSAQGVVVLLSDVSLTSGITISKPVVITSNEAQKPFVVRNREQDKDDRMDQGRIFTITSGELRLQDIILDGGRNEDVTGYHPLICVSGTNACLRMLDGTVLQNAENVSQSMCGGGVNVRRGQAYLYDGSQITHCKARYGGGVEVNSNSAYTQAMLGMAGGSIDSCEADDGGGVYVNIGMFQMQDGEITDNRAVKSDTGGQRTGGGGIYVAGGTGETKMAAVLIGNGKITGNEAVSNGGGILIQGARAQIEMRGGTLKGNRAQCGGGISAIRGTLMLHGGVVTGNTAGLYGGGILGSPYSVLELKGNPRVSGNEAEDTTDRFDNIYLDGAEDDEPSWATAPIRLTGALTEGVQLGMSRWVRPDEKEHPCREMLVPGKGYTITQEDFDRLCDDRKSSHKELYPDNMEQYALIPHDGKIVMVLAADIALDRDSLSLKKAGDTAALTASVTPSNALVKEVTWSSSDEEVVTVDEDGIVTAAEKGKAVITATTVAPYHETASCSVTVGKFYFQLTTRAEHGEIRYTSDVGKEAFEEKEQITLQPVPDKGYQLKEGSLSACQTDDESVKVGIEGDTLSMPDHDVTVTAVFEPVPYPITCHLEGGILKEEETNPDFYTIESNEITLHNPTRSGYRFVGWMGTELAETESVVKIPSGSTGAREYTAVWKEEEDQTTEPPPTLPAPTDTPKPEEQEVDENDPPVLEEDKREEIPEQEDPSGYGEPDAEVTEAVKKPEKTENTQRLHNTRAVKNPQTGSDILWMYAAAVLSGFCMVILTLWYRKWQKRKKSWEKE